MEVGHYHFSVSVGQRRDGGRIDASAKFQYIARLGEYSNLNARRNRQRLGGAAGEVLLHSASSNLPAWAAGDALKFWQASQEFERSNGTQYREFEASLPRGLSVDQQKELINGFVSEHFFSHALSLAIHQKVQSDDLSAEHVHIQISERVLDGIDRPPELFFRRFNQKNPSAGGCKKDSMGTQERLAAFRASWARHCNQALEDAGLNVRVDHRAYRDRGIDLEPEKKLAGKTRRKLNVAQKAEILEARQARREYVHATVAALAQIKEETMDTLKKCGNNSTPPDSTQKATEKNYAHIKIMCNKLPEPPEPAGNTLKNINLMYSTTTPAAGQQDQLHQQLIDLQARVQQLTQNPDSQEAAALAEDLQEIAWQIKEKEKEKQQQSNHSKEVPPDLELIKAMIEGVRVMINAVLRLFGVKELDPFFPISERSGGTTQQVSVSAPGRSVFEIEDEITASKKNCAELRVQLNRAGTRKPRTPQVITYQLFDEALAADPINKKLGAQWDALGGKFEVALDHEKRLKQKWEESNPVTRKLFKLDERLDAAERAATRISWQQQAVGAKQAEHKNALRQEKGQQIMREADRLAAIEAEPEKLKQQLRDQINTKLKKIEALKLELEEAEQRQAQRLEQDIEAR